MAAKALGIACGGTAPQDWWTETGCQEQLMRGFGMTECAEPGYPARTRQNVMDADGTLIVGSDATGGTALTTTIAKHHNKPLFYVAFPVPADAAPLEKIADDFRTWLTQQGVRTLNVAGNRESERPGIREFTRNFLTVALQARKS
jgi:hypothetical protein